MVLSGQGYTRAVNEAAMLTGHVDGTCSSRSPAVWQCQHFRALPKAAKAMGSPHPAPTHLDFHSFLAGERWSLLYLATVQ